NKNEIINYFNQKSITGSSNTRWQDKVTAVTFYCHGLNKTISAHGGENQLGFAYNIKNVNSDNVNFLQSDIEKLDADAFSDTRTVSYSCNAGTKEYIIRGKSFAQEWVNKTGGKARGIVNGRTSYANINSYEGKYGGTIGIELDILSKLSSILGHDTAKQVRKDDRVNNEKGYSEYGSLYNPVMASEASKNYLWEVLTPVGGMIETIRKFDYSWISGHWKTFYPERCE
ncbi:MAG: hypothetical protein K2G55_00390, partial [Lachnospiraceae bacterium]|nr:hypothetical protein [Lachnospiraceae bacterium]